MLQHKNTKKQGDAGLGVAIGYFATQSVTVSLPLTDSQDYDLIVDLADKLNRVQCKTTTFTRNGNYDVNLSTKGGNRSAKGRVKPFDHSKVEYLFVVTGDNTKYFIPTTAFTARYSLRLTTKYRKYIVY